MADARTAAEVDDLLDERGNPRWDELPNELKCSRCGYNLRMLERPRCPECGLEFVWREVMEAQLRRHDWLFEHAWRRRPIRSLIMTIAAALRPWSFWRRLSLHDMVRVGPLWVLLVLSTVPAAILSSALDTVTLWRAGAWYLRFWLDTIRDHLLIVGAFLFALLSLVVGLRQTLGRCRVRSAQILRVFAYSSWPLGMTLAVSLVATQLLPIHDPATQCVAFTAMTVTCGSACIAIPLGRLYLRLPRPWLIASVSVLCASLFATTLMYKLVGL